MKAQREPKGDQRKLSRNQGKPKREMQQFRGNSQTQEKGQSKKATGKSKGNAKEKLKKKQGPNQNTKETQCSKLQRYPSQVPVDMSQKTGTGAWVALNQKTSFGWTNGAGTLADVQRTIWRLGQFELTMMSRSFARDFLHFRFWKYGCFCSCR